MPHLLIDTRPPAVSDASFGDLLRTDDLFADFFNAFLSLPTFGTPLRFDGASAAFEVVDGARGAISRQIRDLLIEERRVPELVKAVREHSFRPFPVQPIVADEADDDIFLPQINTNYEVRAMDFPVGVAWLRHARLPAFRRSRLFSEFRLASILKQGAVSKGGKDFVIVEFRPLDDDAEDSEERAAARVWRRDATRDSAVSSSWRSSSESPTKSRRSTPVRPGDGKSRTASPASLTSDEGIEDEEATREKTTTTTTTELTPFHVPLSVADPQPSTVESFDSLSPPFVAGEKADAAQTPDPRPTKQSNDERDNHFDFAQATIDNQRSLTEQNLQLQQRQQRQQNQRVKQMGNRVTFESTSREENEEGMGISRAASKTYEINGLRKEEEADDESILGLESSSSIDAPLPSPASAPRLSSRRDFESLMRFLRGTEGEKLLNLWLDLDALSRMEEEMNGVAAKAATALIREKYTRVGAPLCLRPDISSKLGLSTSTPWPLNLLSSAMSRAVQPLISYWVPRFLLSLRDSRSATSRRSLLDRGVSALKPRPQSYPSYKVMSAIPLRPKRRDQSSSIDGAVPRRRRRPDPPSPSFDTAPVKRAEDPGAGRSAPPEAVRRLFHLPGVVPRKFMSEAAAKEAANAAEDRKRKSAEKSGGDADGLRRADSDASVASSVFLGGRRCETLLQTLCNEERSGGFFRAFLRNRRLMRHLRCIDCWERLQEFRVLHYEPLVKTRDVASLANAIFLDYVRTEGPFAVGCPPKMIKSVVRRLTPAYEETFDDVEGLVLETLYEAFRTMRDEAVGNGQPESCQIKRVHEQGAKIMSKYGPRGLFKQNYKSNQRGGSPEDLDKMYDNSLWEDVPEQYRGFTINNLMESNRTEIERFRAYLQAHSEGGDVDLRLWADLEALRRIPESDSKMRSSRKKEIRVKYINKKFLVGPKSRVPKAVAEMLVNAAGSWNHLINGESLPDEVYQILRDYISTKLSKKWLPSYLASEEFAKARAEDEAANQFDAADEAERRRKQRMQKMMQLLESRWVTSSEDILAFRKCLLDESKCRHFRRFALLKGELMDNNVSFWIEVQKFKDLVHAHSNKALLEQKIEAIVGCFIQSGMPPPLQIDIPPEQAERIMEQRNDLGPYLFREAQLSCFRILFTQWGDFKTFMETNTTEEAIVAALERSHASKRGREAARQRRQQQQQMARARQQRDSAAGAGFGFPMFSSPSGGEDKQGRPAGFGGIGGGDSTKDQRDLDPIEELMLSEQQIRLTWVYSKHVEKEKARGLEGEGGVGGVETGAEDADSVTTENGDTARRRRGSVAAQHGRGRKGKDSVAHGKSGKNTERRHADMSLKIK